MPNKLEVYKCMRCGNVVQIFEAGSCTPSCCGEPMKFMKEGSTDGALEKLHGIFERISVSPDFGNGRAARNILEAAKMAMSTRLLRGDIDSITEKDARTVLAEDIHSPVQPSNKVEYRRIGF